MSPTGGIHLGGASSVTIPHLAWWKHWHKRWSGCTRRKHGGAGNLASFLSLIAASAKGAGYGVLRNSRKAQRYEAEANASLAFALGREAQKVGIQLRPVFRPLAAGSSGEAR